jgi:nitrogenase molybdenum-iron protein alpha/beta subunit
MKPAKSKRIPIRVSEEDHEKIQAKASTLGLSVSEFLRRAGLSLHMNKTPAVNRRLALGMTATMGNLNQIAHRLNVARSKGGAQLDQAAEGLRGELADLYRQLKEVRDLVKGGGDDWQE